MSTNYSVYNVEDTKEAKRINKSVDHRYTSQYTSPLDYHEDHQKQLLKTNNQLKKDINEIQTNGYIILRDQISKTEMDKIYTKSLELCTESSSFGRNVFEGYKTKRISGLLAKSRLYDKMFLNKRIENICKYYLFPNYLLGITQLSAIYSGPTPQPMHKDGGSYTYLHPETPTKHPFQVSLVWAISDFSANNGATNIIPKSHLWNENRKIDFKNDKIIPVEMNSGSCIVFLDTLYHGGGVNKSNKPRIGLVTNFVQPWLRTQENHFLTVPFDLIVNNKIPKKIQKLIGYSIHTPNYGMSNEVHPVKSLPMLLERYSKL
eukprot:309928_1